MNTPLLQGEKVCLKMADLETVTDAFRRWQKDSELRRLEAADPALPYSRTAIKEWLEEGLFKTENNAVYLTIHRLDDGRLIGNIELEDLTPTRSEAFIGIEIGDRELWGQGYGTDAMRVLLCYAFTEVNLERVSLTVFEYNPRAIRSYEKAGFRHEGRLRGFAQRDGRRWDLLFMGLLRDEWQAMVQMNEAQA
jgi:RimJ/RimL family protein N-acetyltransferase